MGGSPDGVIHRGFAAVRGRRGALGDRCPAVLRRQVICTLSYGLRIAAFRWI